MKPAEYIAIATIVFSLVGTLAGYMINAGLDRRKQQRDQRREAYLEYIKTFVAMADPNEDRVVQGNRQLDHLAARVRLLLFGTEAVITQLKHLYDGPPTLASPEAKRRLASLVASMQKDLSGIETEIEVILKILAIQEAG